MDGSPSLTEGMVAGDNECSNPDFVSICGMLYAEARLPVKKTPSSGKGLANPG